MNRARSSFGATLGAVLASAALLAACGGGDDQAATTTANAEPAADADDTAAGAPVSTAVATAPTTAAEQAPASTDAAETTATTVASDASDGSDTGDDDTIFVNSFDDMPRECVELLEGFLESIEPVVSAIDWSTATSADVEQLFDDNSDLFDGFDEQMESSECARYQFEDDTRTMAEMIPIAEDVAPGVVAWLTAMDQLIGASSGAAGADAPANCDEAIALIDDAIAEGKQLSSLPLAEIGTYTTAMTVLSEDCSPEQVEEFYSREDVGTFLA